MSLNQTTRYDVICLGETMLRLTPPDFKRIEQAVTFEIEIGGSETNTSVGLTRMGFKVAWISRLTNNAAGRLIANGVRGYGVDTSHIIWTDEDRVGIYFLEEGKAPRGSNVIYDRANSAASKIKPEDLPVDLFQPGMARHLHVTGITPALSASAAATTERAVQMAKAAGWSVSFDLNFRTKLWTPEAAQKGCEFFMRTADVLFVPIGDARAVYALDKDASPESVLETLAARYPQAIIITTLSADGAMARATDGAIINQPTFPAQEVDRLGGGDAFSTGFLYGWLTYGQIDVAIRWGAAVAAFKYTIRGDIALVDKEQVEALVTSGQASPKLAR